MDRNTKLLIDLPPDVFLQIFGECDVPDILSLSSTCKLLQLVADEHHVWLHQAIRLQIPIPLGTAPSKAELKDWVISRARVDVCWIKRRPGNLELHSFKTDTEFLGAHVLPGGEFVVLLYETGDIGLNKIERSEGTTGGWDLREVTRYEEQGEGHDGGCCSRLFTETSYGCPVLVQAGVSTYGWDQWEDPLMFFIDPVLQVIEKKGYRFHGFEGFESDSIFEILAMGDRMFFICGYAPEAPIALVSEPSPEMVTGRFTLYLPGGWNADFRGDLQFSLVSESGLIASNQLGIYLYHIPELGAVGEDGPVTISPQWSWSGDASGCSTICKTVSPCPALWIQGEMATHTLEFDVDGSGGFPVVADHQITEGRPAYNVGFYLRLRGRKGVAVGHGLYKEFAIDTAVFGEPDTTRRLRAEIPGLDGRHHRRDEVKYMDLDEVTGRIMIVVGPVPRCYRKPGRTFYAQRLYFADVPI